LIVVYNFISSLLFGPKAPANPWHANTLEWSCPSPPPYYNFLKIPTVYRMAYEYSADEVAPRDYWPQDEPAVESKEASAAGHSH